MQRLLITIFIIFIISQLLGRLRRSQQQEQKRRQNQGEPPAEAPWEFKPPWEMPTSEARVEVKTPVERRREADDEFQASGDESSISTEEDFREETIAKRRPARKPKEASTAPKQKPANIAGIPITPRTISQGVIISEILRRPKF